MKVAFLMHGIGWGGAAGSLLLLLRGLKNFKAEKIFYTTVDKKDNRARDIFINLTDEYDVVDLPQLKNDQAGGMTDKVRFKKIINGDYSHFIDELIKKDIDLIHINSTVLCYLLQPIKENSSVKVVMHVREMLPSYGNGEVQNYMINQIEKYSDFIICISDNEASQFQRSNNLEVLANPFDFESVPELHSNIRKKYDLPAKAILIGMSGQFTKTRGHINYLKAINYLVSRYEIDPAHVQFLSMGIKMTPKWKLFIKKLIGRHDLSYNYEKYINENNLNSYVKSLPYLFTDEYYSLLNELDIYVRASLACDPWGRDIIEAMAFKTPVVATGKSEFFIKPGENGYLVGDSSPKRLSEAIFELIDGKEKRIQFGENGYQTIRQNCDLDKYSSKIKSIFKNLIIGLE